MLHHHLFSLTVVAVLALFSLAAPNSPTSVKLRVEGETTTIFEGTVITTGHNVTTALGGNHHCDGTNNGQNPLPGPTCTSALDDASKIFHFPFDGYVQLFFLISRSERWWLITLLGIVIVHFLPNLMISSSLPSAGTLRQPPNFGVYSLISSSLQLGVANKKSNAMTRSYSRSMLLIKHIS